MMKKIRVLEKVKAFPINGYRCVDEYNNVEIITVGQYYCDGVEYFQLHLDNGRTATYNTVDYIMEFL